MKRTLSFLFAFFIQSSNYIKSRLLVCLVASFLVCHVIGRYHIIRFVLTLWLVDCKLWSILNQLSQFNMIFFQWESQNTVSIQYIFCNNFYNTNDAKAVFPFHSFYNPQFISQRGQNITIPLKKRILQYWAIDKRIHYTHTHTHARTRTHTHTHTHCSQLKKVLLY